MHSWATDGKIPWSFVSSGKFGPGNNTLNFNLEKDFQIISGCQENDFDPPCPHRHSFDAVLGFKSSITF